MFVRSDYLSDEASGQAKFRFLPLVGSIYFPSFLVAAGIGALLPVVPLLAREMGAGLWLTGLVVGMRPVGILLLDIPSGFLSRRFGNKAMMMASAAVAGMAGFGAALVPGLLALSLFTLIMGGSFALLMVARLSHMADTLPSRLRGRALSLIGGVHRIGMFVGPVAGGFLARRFGLRSVFFVQGAVGLAVFLLLLALMEGRAPRRVRSQRGAVPPMTVRLSKILAAHRRSFLTTGLAVVALSLVRSARQILIPLWGSEIGLDVAVIGLILGSSSAIDMTLFYPAGYIMDHYGRKWSAIPCILILSSSLVFMPLTHSSTALLLVSLLAGFGNGLGSGIAMTLGADLSPRRGGAEFLGMWRLIGDIGSTGGPLIIGAVAQAVALGLASVIAASIGLAGAVFMLFMVAETLGSPRR
jgi:MFS family permease